MSTRNRIEATRLRVGHTEGGCMGCHAPSVVVLQVIDRSRGWTTRFCADCGLAAANALLKAIAKVGT